MQQDNHNVNDGSIQDTPEVKAAMKDIKDSGENTNLLTTENEKIPDREPVVEPVVEVVINKVDPDEKILNDFYESGKTEVTSNDLINAGFDSLRISEYAFEIGSFKLTRLLLVSPYKIEKTN